MKKIFLYALFLCCSIACVQAQGKQSLGLQVGFTQPITRLNSPVPGKETTLNPTTYNGLKVGVIYDATIVAGFGYAAFTVPALLSVLPSTVLCHGNEKGMEIMGA